MSASSQHSRLASFSSRATAYCNRLFSPIPRLLVETIALPFLLGLPHCNFPCDCPLVPHCCHCMFVSFLPALYLRFLSEIFQNSRFLHLFLTGTHRHWTGTQGHWTGTQRHFRGHFCGTQILPFGTQVLAEDTPGYFGGTQVPSTGTQVLPIVLPSCLTPSPLYLLPDWLLEFLGVFHNFNLIFGLTNTCDGLFGGSVGPVRLLGLLGLKQTCHLGQQPWLGAHLYKGLNGVLQSPAPEARLHQVWSGGPLLLDCPKRLQAGSLSDPGRDC